jgi:hypothetical protein
MKVAAKDQTPKAGAPVTIATILKLSLKLNNYFAPSLIILLNIE